jgi:hypothetical protein
LLSGFTEQTRAEIKRRILLEEHRQEATHLDEAEDAVTVANAAIAMTAGALQQAAGFDSNDHTFEEWMTASTAEVEREIAAAKSKPDGAPASKGVH